MLFFAAFLGCAQHYFPRVEALLIEASLDVATPDARALFAGGSPDDPVAREKDDELPARQNRRTPLI